MATKLRIRRIVPAINSGPLSLRMCSGTPRIVNWSISASTTPRNIIVT
jgi:hypothetical protein